MKTAFTCCRSGVSGHDPDQSPRMKSRYSRGVRCGAGLVGQPGQTGRDGMVRKEFYRKNGWNWFGNGSVVNRKMLERNNLTRYFRAQNEVWENGFAFKNENQSTQLKGGVDWYYSKKTTVGILVSGNINQFNSSCRDDGHNGMV